MAANEDRPWYVQLLVSLVLLLLGAVLLCVTLGVFGVAGAIILGLRTGSSGSGNATIPAVSTTPPPSTRSPAGNGRSTGPGSSRQVITLSASPKHVPPYGRIDLRGTWSAPDGTRVQVQRRQPGTPWRNFPSSTIVSGGRFSLFIKTGHTGVNYLRVANLRRSVVSNVVQVRVH